jgi:hypothetical protein
LELTGIGVVEVVAEKRVGLNEGATAGDDLGAALGEQVEGGEVLKDAHRVSGAEDGDGVGQPNPGGAGSVGGDNDGGSGGDELRAVVFADAKDVEPDLVSQLDLLDQVADALDGIDGEGRWRGPGSFRRNYRCRFACYPFSNNYIDVNTPQRIRCSPSGN